MNSHQLYVLSVWIHILAMATWLGGMVFLAVVVLPVLRRGPEHQLGAFMAQAAPRLRAVGWTCLALLGITGFAQLGLRHHLWSQGLPLLKIVVFSTIVLLSLVHDFWLGPMAAEALRQAPRELSTLKLRRLALSMGRITALLGVLAFTIGVSLVRGVPW